MDPEGRRFLGPKRQCTHGEVARHEAGESRQASQLRELRGLVGVVACGGKEAEEVGREGRSLTAPLRGKFEQLAPLTDAGLTPYPDVGFVGDPIDIPLFPRVSGEQTFHGSFWGNNADLTEVMALAAEGKIQHTIKTISFDDINEHIDLMRDNKIVGRAVVTF